MDPNHRPNLAPEECDSNVRYNKDLLSRGDFGDCTVRCRHRSWRAHRNILSPRCKFFETCFNGIFRESAGVNQVVMNDDQPEAVEGLLFYLYTQEYPHELRELDRNIASARRKEDFQRISSSMENNNPLPRRYQFWTFDLLMFSIADKYNLQTLMRLARQSLEETISQATKPNNSDPSSSSFISTLDHLICPLVDDLYGANGIENSAESMQDLRRHIIGAIARPVAQHIRHPQLSELVEAYPEFAVDLLEAVSKSIISQELALPGTKTDKVANKEDRNRTLHIPMNEDSEDDEY